MRSRTKLLLLIVGVAAIGLAVAAFMLSGPRAREAAREAFWDRDYPRAVLYYQRLSERGELTDEDREDYVRALVLTRRFTRADRIFRDLIARFPRSDVYPRRLAEMLVAAGTRDKPMFQRAEDYGRTRIQADPADPVGHYAIGLALSRRLEEEWSAFKDDLLANHGGANVWGIIHSVDWCLRHPNFARARQDIVTSLGREADLPPKHPIFAKVDHLHRTKQDAIDHLETARRSLRCRGHAILELARVYHLLLNATTAERLLTEVLAHADKDVDLEVKVQAHRLFAESLERRSQDPAVLRRAVPHWGSYLIGLADLKMTMEDVARARFRATDARGRLGVLMRDATLVDEVAATLLEGDRSDSTGLYYRGMAHAFRDEYKDAKTNLLASLNRGSNYRALMTLGNILVAQGGPLNTEQALGRYQDAAKLRPDKVEPALAIASLHVAEGRYRSAQRVVANALARPDWRWRIPDRIYELRDRIEIALLDPERKPIEDLAAAKRAIGRNDRDRSALHFLATHWAEKRNYAKARPFAERLAVVAKKHIIAHLLLARVAIGAGDLDAAQRAIRDAQEVDPADARPVKLLAEVARRRGDIPRCTALLREATELDPRDWETHFGYARLIARSPHMVGAARYHVDRAMELNPTPPYDLRRLDLRLRLAQGDLKAAREAVESVCRDPRARAGDFEYFTGLIHERSDEMPAALAAYEAGIEKAPDRADLVVRLADLYLAQPNRRAAATLLHRFYRSGGRDVDVNARLIDILMDDWHLEPALKLAKEMQRLAPGDERGYLLAGRIATYLGRVEMNQLIAMYVRGRIGASNASPEESEALLCSTIHGLLQLGQWRIALERIHDLDKRLPGSIARARALLAFFSGDERTARSVVTEGLAEKPGAPFLRLIRGVLDLRDGKLTGVVADAAAAVPGVALDKGWPAFARAVARRRPGFGRLILATVAECHLLRGEVIAANDILDVARSAYPNDGRLAYLKGHVLRRAGDAAEAMALLTRAQAGGVIDAARDRAVLLALDRDAAAVPLLEEYAKVHPRDGGLLLLWAQFEIGGAEWANALRALRREPHWEWDLTDTIFLTGLSYIVDGPDGARSQLPDRSSVSGAYLHELLQQSNVRNELRFVALWRSLIRGIALSDLPHFRDRAIQFTEDALATDPEHPLFLDLLARQRIRFGQYDRARKLYRDMRAAAGAGLRALGLARVDAHDPMRWDAAVKAFEAVLRDYPKTSLAYVELAALHLRRGHPRAAIEALDRAEKALEAPFDSRIYSLRGRALDALGPESKAAAIEAYANALVADRRRLDIAYTLTRRMLDAGRAEGLQLYARMPAVRLRYRDLDLHVGLRLFELERYRDARPLLIEFPYSPEAAFALGMIHRREGRLNEAIAQFEFAFTLDPTGQPEAMFQVIEIQKRRLKSDEALVAAKRLVAYHPTDARGHRVLADLYERALQIKDALMAHFRAWQLQPSDPRPMLRVIALAREDGQHDLARKVLGMLTPKMDRWPEDVQKSIRRLRLLLGE